MNNKILFLLFSCGVYTAGAAAVSAPLDPPSTSAKSETLFELVDAAESGLVFDHTIDYKHPLKAVYHSSMSCGGVAIGDVNGDGKPDVFVTSGPGLNGLFLNQGNMKFVNATDAAGVGGEGAWSSGAAMADIDNDGDLDIMVANYDSPNHLFINDGNAVFTERASVRGLDLADGSLMPAFCDYDQDGDLDVYLVTYRLYWPDGRPDNVKSQIVNGKLEVLPPHDRYFDLEPGDPNDLASWPFKETGRPDFLYRNNGNGTFTDVTAEAGIIADRSMGNSVTWYDYNNDGWMDIYVGNDFIQADCLYENQRDGTFREVLRNATPHTPWYSMGAGVGDLNGDGYQDLFVADMAATTHYTSKVNMGDMFMYEEFLDTAEPRQFMRNAVYLGTGTHRLMEGGYISGLAKTGWSWAVQIFDADGDGAQDVFVSNGMVRDFMNADALQVTPEMMDEKTAFEIFENEPERREKNIAFHNQGALKFKKVSEPWGLDYEGMSYGAARGDLDGDGDLDLVVCNLDDPVHLYRNHSQHPNRLAVSLVGSKNNRQGIGATVRVVTPEGEQVQQVNPHQGFASSNDPALIFGLGDASKVTRVEVTWPGGAVQTAGPYAAGQHIVITEQDAALVAKPARPTMYKPTTVLEFARHKETLYDDFADQPLLPNKLSQNGPGMAFADVNGDGKEDFFSGGAAGSVGELHLQVAPGKYKWKSAFILNKAKPSEDMAPLFFDADGDGDQDLYVVSGSVEADAGSEVYRDRLYLNDGAGKFSVAPEGSLPALRDSGSVVVAADYDRDGDLDLFVGSRVIPKRYPLPASSRLLRNDGGRFVDISSAVAPDFHEIGLVTSAVWSDANDDGWIDLLVTTEWGPVRLFRNEQGQLLRNVTVDSGLEARSGWWNGIAARDIDNDGDIDYLVTNAGLNTKYKASHDQPATIFYGDFDGSGKAQVVEATYENGKLLPRRGRSCSSNAMPFIAEKFKTYHDFALASLQEVYTPTKLQKSLQLEVNDLRSVVLVNDGTGSFSFQALPREVQISTGFGVVLTDLNGDGLTDAAIAQNFFHPQRETPRIGGGLGAVLIGKGDGSFEHLGIAESGIDVPEDARGLAVTDLNGDRYPDLVFTINDGVVRTFENQLRENQPVKIVLAGPSGNPTGIGARVRVQVEGLPVQVAEVQAGGSYLSQSSAGLFFGAGKGNRVARISVRWPDGTVQEFENPKGLLGTYRLTRE